MCLLSFGRCCILSRLSGEVHLKRAPFLSHDPPEGIIPEAIRHCMPLYTLAALARLRAFAAESLAL